MAPSAAPAPTTVCSSSMNRMTRPSASLISLRTAFRRSSNSPRNLAPAISAPEVERDDALVLERSGNVTAHDPLGEALGDGGLADARLADEHRVVLGPTRQDLHDPADLLVAPDDGIELASARFRGQIAAVLLEGGVGSLGVLRGDPLAAPHALERLKDGLAAGRVALQELLPLAADLGDAEEQMLGGDVVVAEPLRFRLGGLDHAAGARIQRQRAALDPGAPGEDGSEFAAEPRQVDSKTSQGLGGDTVVGFDQGRQDVLGVQDRAVEPLGRGLGGEDGLLGLLGEAFKLHVGLS